MSCVRRGQVERLGIDESDFGSEEYELKRGRHSSAMVMCAMVCTRAVRVAGRMAVIIRACVFVTVLTQTGIGMTNSFDG